jgi:hypothetical protein
MNTAVCDGSKRLKLLAEVLVCKALRNTSNIHDLSLLLHTLIHQSLILLIYSTTLNFTGDVFDEYNNHDNGYMNANYTPRSTK